jgi:hypothetical protein
MPVPKFDAVAPRQKPAVESVADALNRVAPRAMTALMTNGFLMLEM